ncbi:DMT family transporter [Halioxenophilus sp. WMMB6]|uniref:DMT family transporter n=1 Tax=Halioxenophilus sp. WMMB6 TaxID=3073815 RepID=UPI00295E6000|nr:EamA family transporter [Halioxenophilus sp. WMMB6]
MPLATTALYLLVALIWGSTWIVITLQLGTVDPLASVIYRFALASSLLFAWCFIRGQPLKLSLKQHGLMIVQGSFLFGLNYWILYLATQHLTSGLIAATFSTIVFFNALNGRIFLKMAIRSQVIVGGCLGLVGVLLLFAKELQNFTFADTTTTGLALALFATLLASLGNITAAHNTNTGLSVLAINAWAMCYGTVTMAVIALLLGTQLQFDTSITYLGALAYLVLFGSIITFAGYLRLIKTLGPDKAAYMSMLIPFIALQLSALFEEYQWTLAGSFGLLLILAGNWWAMRK